MNLHDEIAMVAYELYETRNCVRGYDLDDWLGAERIVLSRHAGQEIEEPEEEGVSEEGAPDVSKAIKDPDKGTVEQTEESYCNEEMS
jgi:hypothetical protein